MLKSCCFLIFFLPFLDVATTLKMLQWFPFATLTPQYTTVVNNIAARLLRLDGDCLVIAVFTLVTIVSIIFRKFTSWKLSNEFHIRKSGFFTCSFEFRSTTQLSLSVRENVVNIPVDTRRRFNVYKTSIRRRDVV